MRKISCFVALFLVLMTFNTFAADLSIKLDKNSISMSDILYLTVTYTGEEKIAPELDSLQKDFRVVSNSTSSQINFINGVMSQSKKWTFGLVPLHTGKITIPPIRLDNLISNSVEVEVTDVSDVAYAPDRKENSNSPFFKIAQSIDTKEPYVQQQVMLYVNIYDSVGMREGGPVVDEESKKDWIITPINEEPIIRQETVDNRQMNVLTYVYAIFPQKSGELVVPEISFDGYYVRSSGFSIPGFGRNLSAFGIDMDSVFGQRIPVHMKAKKEVISVLPIPDNYSARKWLPLNNLEIEATWSVKHGFKVGEAASRTIDLKAIGMMEGMLPQIEFKETAGLKQYPEKPTIEQKIDNGKIITTAQYNTVYIPTKAGEIVVPKVELQWFNVVDKKFEKAVIPEETILVLPNPEIETDIQESTVETNKTETVNEESLSEEKEKNKKTAGTLSHNMVSDIKSFFKAYVLFFILAFIALIFLVLLTKKKKNNLYRDSVIYALKKHDYKKSKEALLDWARHKFYPADINNFNDISCLINDAVFSEQLSAFNRFLYSANADYFDAAKFIEILKKIDKLHRKENKKAEVLPNLYD